jgi:hypothetical protein
MGLALTAAYRTGDFHSLTISPDLGIGFRPLRLRFLGIALTSGDTPTAPCEKIGETQQNTRIAQHIIRGHFAAFRSDLCARSGILRMPFRIILEFRRISVEFYGRSIAVAPRPLLVLLI